MHATLGCNPSYTWKSIWASRGLIEKGISWTIGDGRSVNIWNDVWVPGLPNGRIVVDSISTQFSWVADLIDEQGRTWKEDVIRLLFTHDQAEQILKIPLAEVPILDFYTWRYDTSGIYNVKSGYKLLMGPEYFSSTELSDLQKCKKRVFDSVWSCPIPSKVQITCWKFIKNYIPTALNLAIRRVPVNTDCLLCDSSPESVQHVLECNFLSHVLQVLHVNLTYMTGEQQWLQWLAQLFENLSAESTKRFLVAIWATWGYRNKRFHENANQRPMDIADFVFHYISEFEDVAIIRNPKPKPKVNNWLPPPTNYVKANFDASFQAITKITCIGVIIRNENGLIMGAGSYPNLRALSLEVAEALSCRNAVRLVLELAFRRVLVEGDFLQIINKLLAPSFDRSPSSPIIQEIKQFSGNFLSLSFLHVLRDFNKAAHALAKDGRRFDSPRIWIEEAPTTVEAVAREDRLNRSS
ncbi:hypothetical protein like AT4G29090 [Hibiscus trionum]|uniref:RNase H type-1 domain-containing protein n=1 Tax=Hibiscus trionum TaxID=183268 RepID=A0A9W7H792_HIBTR|nr:hypothetical protein like AT4G29090 [Hibiscus trionum]